MALSDLVLAPTFFVGHLPIYGDLILAPMDGISDLPFRQLARALGSSMSYTEFINGIDVIHGHPLLEKRLSYLEAERPVVYQLLDNDPERLLAAALVLRQRNPDIIDVNMGCSARSVVGRGAGAALLRDPQKVAAIFKALTQALDIPVTGKIRLGWDENTLNYLEVAHAVEENGGKLLAVHGRTRQQAYNGRADWEAIARVKAELSIPVIGNGDVQTVTDIARLKEQTGCDGVMIGRAAIDNPWIFNRLDRSDVPLETVHRTIQLHLERMIAFYGDDRGVIQFRKFAKRYLDPYHLERSQVTRLLTYETVEDVLQYLDELLNGIKTEQMS